MTQTINLSCALAPVVFGSKRFTLIDNASKIFFGLMTFNFLTECAAWYAAVRYRQNLPVYNVCAFVQIFLLAMYFNYSIKLFRKRNIGIYIGILCVLVGIINTIYLEPINSFQSNYFAFDMVFVFTMSTILFVQFITLPYSVRVQNEPHFWFAMAMIFFYVLNYFTMSLYKYFPDYDKATINSDDAILFVNALTNVSIAFIFLFYPKIKSRNV